MRFILLFLIAFNVTAEDNNQSGDLNSNTQNSTVNSNNTTNSKTYNGAGSSGMPVTSSISPTLMSSGNDSCLRSQVNGLQLAVIGFSNGTYLQDTECNRRKDAKTLRELGMSVAAVALMCQNDGVWRAMFTAGTPCPILVNGKLIVGRNAYLVMRKNPDLYVMDYKANKLYYDSVMGIGLEIAQNEETSTLSISDRFRTSKRDR